MKVSKLLYLMLALLVLTNSINVKADYNVRNPAFAGSNVRSINGRDDALRDPNFKNAWILDVKLAEMRRVGILGDSVNKGQFDFVKDIFKSFKNLPDSISRIHMYGDGRSENTTLLIFGGVNETWLEKFIVEDLYNKGNKKFTYSKKILGSVIQDITKLSIQSVDNQTTIDKTVYFSVVKSGLYVISSNIYEVRRWRDYPRSIFYYLGWPNHNVLFSLKMNIQRTFKNMKKDYSGDVYMLKSKIFKESRDINFVVEEGKSKIFIGAYINTKEPNQAEDLKHVFSDLLSKNNIESGDIVRNQLFNNLKIIQKKNSLRIGSTITKSSFNKTSSK